MSADLRLTLVVPAALADRLQALVGRVGVSRVSDAIISLLEEAITERGRQAAGGSFRRNAAQGAAARLQDELDSDTSGCDRWAARIEADDLRTVLDHVRREG